VAAAIALSWALPAAGAGGPAYANAILFSQTGERVVHSFAHRRSWWWYLAALPLLLYPYSLWPPLWRRLGLLRPRAADAGTRFCLAWVLPALAAFSAISGKQPHYLLPLFPAFALLAARLLEGASPPRRWSALPAAAVLLLVAVAVAGAPLLAHRPGIPGWAGQVWPVPGLLLALAAIACVAFAGRIFTGRPAAPTLLTLLLLSALYLAFAAPLRRAYDLRPVARYLASAEREGRPIAYAGDYHGQLHFLGRLVRPFEEIPPAAGWRWLESHPRGKVVEELDGLPAGARAGFVQPYRTHVLAVWNRGSIQ
jgi:4-amino-4-deoxy-L-arabinose transferase-like glycosyltransferase